MSIPDQGDAGKWVLASGSDVTHLAMATDGTLYAAANPSATTQRLFKSTDNGTSWSPTGQVTATIVDIATSRDDPSLVYYATASNVYRSQNAGTTFVTLPPSPGAAGANNVSITSIAVTGHANNATIVVATRDADPGQYGGVYTLDSGRFFSAWLDTSIGNYDVLAVDVPRNPAVRQIVAVASNETSTAVIAKTGPVPWGSICMPAIIQGVPSTGATISLPDDYSLDPDKSTLFVGLKTGTERGDVYKVRLGVGGPGLVVDLDAGASLGQSGIDIGALDVGGDSTAQLIVAGAAASSGTFTSSDNGSTWAKSTKVPTGASVTGLVVASDDIGLRVLAATSGPESAFSRSDDRADTWYQTGLIDTQISPSGLIDLAVSPSYSQDATVFLLTWGGKHSLWRSRDGGESWQRVLCSALPNFDALSMMAISPRYGQSGEVLYVTGASGASPAVWRSSDGGETFARRYLPYAVGAWSPVSENAIFVCGYEGTVGLVCSTSNGGLFYSQPVVAGNQPLKSIGLSPDFARDMTILVGNSVGKVYMSTDNGTTFRQLGQTLPLSGTGVGQVSLAFDADFGHSKRVFAATDAASTTSSRERIFTLVIGKSDAWESIDSTLPVGSIVGKIAVAQDGALYACNSKAVVAATPQGGFERSLEPNASGTSETVVRGLNDGATLRGIWSSGNRLWSLDTTNGRLMTFSDTLTQPPILVAPESEAGGVETEGLRLEWHGVSGCTSYQLQLSDDDSFSDLSSAFDVTTQGSVFRAPPLQFATTYYWRVRANGPLKGPWSEKSSFTTKLGGAVVAPQLLSPEAGTSGVPPNPIFAWTSLAEAETYELMVGTDPTFSTTAVSMTGSAALTGTAWQSDLALNNGATYFWKVRAVGGKSASAWSNVGAFTVQFAPSPTPVATASPPETQIVQVTVPAPAATTTVRSDSTLPVWLVYAVFGTGLVLIGLLLTILVVLLKQR